MNELLGAVGRDVSRRRPPIEFEMVHRPPFLLGARTREIVAAPGLTKEVCIRVLI